MTGKVEVVKPVLGSARENPVCPVHKLEMRARVARDLEAGLTHLWWSCPAGGCVTPFVPLPGGAVKNLGPRR